MTNKELREQRRKMVEAIADEFDNSGAEYSSAAVVIGFALPRANVERAKMDWPNVNQFSARNIATLVEREVYSRWFDVVTA